MTVDVLSLHGPVGKLVPRQAPPALGTCPIWCESPHDSGDHDDADYHHGANIMIPMYRGVTIADGNTYAERDCEVRVGLEQNPGQRHPRVIFEGALATWLTAGEADNLATILQDFVADMSKASAGRELCWCDQKHAPGDGHHSEVKSVYLTSYERRPGSDPRELCVMAAQPPHQRAYIEVCDAHHGDTATHLLPSQAERIADALTLLSLAIRLYEKATR